LGWGRLLHSSSFVSEPVAPKPVALSKLKDSFNDATSGKGSFAASMRSITSHPSEKSFFTA
jgi:hypothetical protein